MSPHNSPSGLPEDAKARLSRWFSQEEMETFRYTRRGPICLAFRHIFRQGAVTWNKVVNFARDPYDPETPRGLALIAHEMVHVRQQRQQGWWPFLVQYLWLLRKRAFRGSQNRNHPLEQPAYELAAEVRAVLEDSTPPA